MKKLDKKSLRLIIITLVVGFFLGWVFTRNSSSEATSVASTESDEEVIYTCSMHPEIRQSEPGDCPLCGMDLTPLQNEGESTLPPNALRMSETAMQLAQVQTQEVGFGGEEREVALSGKVTLNEERVYSQAVHIEGRVEELAVNSLGQYVKKGQLVAKIYSPELIAAQKELIQAAEQSTSFPHLLEAVKQKLALWKLTPQQIDAIVESKTIKETMEVYADHNGYVVSKEVEKGDYLQQGQSIFQIADMSRLWVVFDVFEKDALVIQRGQKVLYSFASYPGREFEGTLDIIEPILNPDTRTLRARMVIANSDMKWRPEMLVKGKVILTNLGGAKDLMVPKSAVMWTGKHSVVYVKHTSDGHIGFEMRPVVLGDSYGKNYLVLEGLDAGEEVVVNGTFSVDAAAQLANRPSMMNHTHPATQRIEIPELDFSGADGDVLKGLMRDYLTLKDHLASDQYEESFKVFSNLHAKIVDAKRASISSALKGAFEELLALKGLTSSDIKSAADIEKLRTSFQPLSNFFIGIVAKNGTLGQRLYVQHCPMAFDDQGADWISTESEIFNPYFGSAMLRCGEVTQTLG